VRELEERGIGRPSTYAEIISKVQARDYVEKMDGTRFPPDDARQVRRRWPRRSELDFMDPRSRPRWRKSSTRSKPAKKSASTLLKRFYKRFRAQLDKSKKGKRWNPEPEPTTRSASSTAA
jgi:DNA topoisomerase-1